MKIIIPNEVIDCISATGNKTAQKNGYKIYAALLRMNKRRNSHGYFPCPSEYLESINKRYSRTVKALVKSGIIKPFTRPEQDKNDIFLSVDKRFYNVRKGICIKYKFLIDISKGRIEDIDFDNQRKLKWYKKVQHSLNELGYEESISRDTFGRRVHHSAIATYKEDLKERGFALIDAKCSQPKLLLKILKENGITDTKYEESFDLDFYSYLVKNLNLKDRTEAKDLFMFWLNSSGYVPNFKIHILFPQASSFIKSLKSKYYKDASSFLQRIEAKIWIDDLLTNIPVDFALPVHDCLIVRDKEVYEVLDYCKSKYEDIDFEVSFL